jgi:hypothetical protein
MLAEDLPTNISGSAHGWGHATWRYWDRTFRWNGRLWNKTTKGLCHAVRSFLATRRGPKSRVVRARRPSHFKLPIAWVLYGGRKSAGGRRTVGEGGRLDETGWKASSASFAAATHRLLRFRETIAGSEYAQTGDGNWIKRAQLVCASPTRVRRPERTSAKTDALGGTTTLDTQGRWSAFRGHSPVYATLIRAAKKSKDKDKDHATPTGEWRVPRKAFDDHDGRRWHCSGRPAVQHRDVPYVI